MSNAYPSARTKRRRRGRPLAEFASRSPVHAFAVWLIRAGLILVVGLAAWTFVSEVVIPGYVDRMVEQVQSQ